MGTTGGSTGANAGADELEEAVEGCVALLRTATGADWRGPDWEKATAGRLEWSCRYTAEHIAGDLIAYAGQLAGRAQNAYFPFDITFDDGTDNSGVLEVIWTTGALPPPPSAPPRARCVPSTRTRSAARTARASPRWAPPRCCCTPTTSPRAWA